MRALRDALESRYRVHIDRHSNIVPWVISHAAATTTMYQVSDDGLTARGRLKGKSFSTEPVEFGECVWYLKLSSTGKFKWESIWDEGVWLGVRERSGEAIIGADVGVTKSRTVRRKGSHDERWSVTLLESMRGAPWAVVPGKGMSSIPVNIQHA